MLKIEQATCYGGSKLRHDHHNCVFLGPGANTDFSDAFFFECDFTAFDFKNSIFKLSCKQGTRNKITAQQFAMFVFWINEVFDLPPTVRRLVALIIGPYKEELRLYFDQQ